MKLFSRGEKLKLMKFVQNNDTVRRTCTAPYKT